MTMYSYSRNRHSDPADAAAHLETRLNDLRVRSARAQAASLRDGKGTADCVDCDETIDRRRKEAVPSATRCASCQDDHDHVKTLTAQGGEPG